MERQPVDGTIGHKREIRFIAYGYNAAARLTAESPPAASARRAPFGCAILARALAGLLLIGLIGLAGCGKPTPYTTGSRIPLETYTVTVSRMEDVIERDQRRVVVHLHVTGGKPREAGRFFAMFAGHMRIIDSAGKEYGATPYTLDTYYRQSSWSNPRESIYFSNSLNPEEWVAVAAVPAGARGFSFYIGNPNRLEGQSRAAIVRLQR